MKQNLTELSKFTAKELCPSGWLKQQLRTQADGLSGHLDEIWPDIRESRYIGGDQDGWERVPYWLDGIIPLAWLLNDEKLKEKAQRYVDAIIDRQEEFSGWLAPCRDDPRANDIWPFFLVSKVLVLYYECTDDPRIDAVLYRAFLHLYHTIEEAPLINYAKDRWQEALFALRWLSQRHEEAWIPELAQKLCQNGKDYGKLFDDPKMKETVRQWTRDTHVVNVAQGIKGNALYARFAGGDPDADAEKIYQILMEYHGAAAGHFTGDECLAGTAPNRGAELCSVAEAMFSYQTLFLETGNFKWIDRLERLAFNSLPAAISTDMWTHQYDQLSNQIQCTPLGERSFFGSNNGEAHLFGLEPHFGCCTANFNQAWPKFALSGFFRNSGGIVSASLIPSCVQTEIDGVPLSVRLDTLYPFREQLHYTITTEGPVSFALTVRIPAWVSRVSVDGIPAQVQNSCVTLQRTWTGETTVDVEFTFTTEFEKRPRGLTAFRYGALTFSLPIDEKWTMREYTENGVERKYPYCDYTIEPLSKWNYAYADRQATIVHNDNFGLPFSTSNPPVSVAVNVVEIPWSTEEGFPGICAEVPDSLIPQSPVKTVLLKPYGCTNLRMTELPLIQGDPVCAKS